MFNNIDFFIASSSHANIHKIVKVENSSKKKLNKTELEGFVKEICKKEFQNNLILDSINIIDYEKNLYEVEGKRLVVKAEGEKLSDLEIKTIEVSGRSFATQTMTLKEIYSKFQSNWSDKRPIVQLFFNIAVCPFVLFYRCLSPKVYDLADLKQQDLPANEESMLTALKWTQSIFSELLSKESDPLSKYGKNEEFSLSAQLAESEKIGRDWHASNANQQKKQAESQAKTIIQRFDHLNAREDLGEASQAKAINLMLIPSGYWKDGVFQPVVLSFYRNKEGHFCLSEMTYGEKEGPVVRDFIWEKGAMDEEKLSNLLKTIMPLANKPADPYKPIKLVDIIQTGFASAKFKMLMKDVINANIVPKDLLFAKPVGIEETRQKMMFVFDAQILKEERPKKSSVVKEDPWKVLQQTITLQFPEAHLADKACFTLGLLNDRLQRIILSLDDLKPEQREKWIIELNNDWRKFERQLRKTLGTEEAAQLLTKESPFKHFEEQLTRLNQEVEKLTSERLAKQEKTHRSFLDRLKETPFTLRAVSEKKSTQDVSLQQYVSLINQKDLDNVSKLKTAFFKMCCLSKVK